MRHLLIPFLLSLLLASCSSVHYFTIETLEPAEVTFPKDVKTVLIVNNAVPQPEDMGITVSYRKAPANPKIKTDSAIFVATRSIGEAIAASPFFEDVRLYEKAYNEHGTFQKDSRMSQSEVEELCELNESDAVISLDHLYFSVTKTIDDQDPQSLYPLGSIKVIYSSVVRAHIPERISPLATMQVVDSLFFYDEGSLLPSIAEAISMSAEYMGEVTSNLFIPNWQEDNRLIYRYSNSTTWKNASAYAYQGKWKLAANIWEELYNKTKSEKKLARIATNLAIANELSDDLPKAAEWVEKALDHYMAISEKSVSHRDSIFILQYKAQLERKIAKQPKLEQQLQGFE